MGGKTGIAATAAAALLACIGVQAQDPIATAPEPVAAQAWDYYGDLLLRAEQTRGIPARTDDLERIRSRIRFGVRREFGAVEFGVAAEGALGSDRNADNRSNNDNERSDALNLDEFYLRWRAGDDTTVLLGKTAFPIQLTPLTWDEDLRPIGLSVSHALPVGDFHRLQLTGGYFAGDHLYDDESRIAAAQLSWFWNEGAALSGDAQLAWLDFSDLQTLVDHGLGRTNRRVAGVLVSDYRLLDLQLGMRALVGESTWRARLDLLRNTGADQNNEGARFSAIYGDSRVDGGLEVGLAVQRFQRDAALAAFNSDDWWFHSFARGVMPWVAYGINDRWRVQLSGFRERRDALVEHTDRVLLDVRATW